MNIYMYKLFGHSETNNHSTIKASLQITCAKHEFYRVTSTRHDVMEEKVEKENSTSLKVS